MPLRICPRCSNKRVYDVRRGKCRCARCKYEWMPDRLPLHLTEREWRQLLRPFLQDKSGRVISDETGLHRQRILRALTVLRMAMGRDVPAIFKDRTAVNAESCNAKRAQRVPRAAAPDDNDSTDIAHPEIYGIWCSQDKVWARVMREREARYVLPSLKEGTFSDDGGAGDAKSDYSGIAFNGRIYRMNRATPTQGERASGTEDGLHDFGKYLMAQLAARRGIRRNRLPLYLAEWVWRFNHRTAPVTQQEEKLMTLLQRY